MAEFDALKVIPHTVMAAQAATHGKHQHARKYRSAKLLKYQQMQRF